MRGSWDNVEFDGLQTREELLSQRSQANGSNYDFGINRPMTAPPSSDMGFGILDDLKKWNLHDDVDTENSSGLDEGDDVLNGFSNGSKNNLDNSIGAFISRPKSAAPQLNSSRIFPSLNDDNKVHSPAYHHDDLDIMNLGSRRPASTDLIHNEGNGKDFLASRKHHSFMDLIEEDIPSKAHRDAGVVNTSHHSIDASLKNLNMNSLKNPKDAPVQPLSNPQSVNMNNYDGYNIPVQQSPPRQFSQQYQNGYRPNNMHSMDPNHHSPVKGQYVQQQQQYNPTQHMQHPQFVPSNVGAPAPMYVNANMNSMYNAMQYQNPTLPYHQQGQYMHQTPAMTSQMHHPQQYITAIPVHNTVGAQAPNGAQYIYVQQAFPGTHGQAQPITIVDANGRPATILAHAGMHMTGSSPQPSSPHMMSKQPDKMGRRNGRQNGRKNATPQTMDASKQSLSSSTLCLLEEYRCSKDRAWTAFDVTGHIIEFCQDQNGSRFIQQRLEIADDEEKKLITEEILPSFHLLRNDVFGNYVVQKLFEHCNSELKSKLKNTLAGKMVELSSHMYGCRVVQKAIEKVADSELVELLSEFHDCALSCIHDQNGNHVIQKVVEVISNRSKIYQAESHEKAASISKDLDFILNCVKDNVVALSCHPFGCRVLQRILEHCIESQKALALDSIQGYLRTLLDDQYGNYVIQHVLQYGRKSDRDIVLEIIVENGILGLARQKFASNVIEKLLKYGNASHRNAIVREMLNIVDDKSVETGKCSIVLLMVRDAYANYVVQTTLDVVPEGEEKELLIAELRANAAKLRNYTFAKHIITKLDETTGKFCT